VGDRVDRVNPPVADVQPEGVTDLIVLVVVLVLVLGSFGWVFEYDDEDEHEDEKFVDRIHGSRLQRDS